VPTADNVIVSVSVTSGVRELDGRPKVNRAELATALVLLVSVLSFACGKQQGPAIDVTGLPVLTITSDAFADRGAIPAEFTCNGRDVSPPLRWRGAPANAGAFVLLVEDPDAGSFTHWVIYNLPGSVMELSAGASPGGMLPSGSQEGKNDFGNSGYGGPCPPKGSKPHRYKFQLYALDASLGLGPGRSKADVRRSMQGHVVGFGEVVGTFQR
jgi:Raf kinase inhibitor-like YbhB/YbcL family protein